MIGITIKHLRYFEALAHHGHFSRAAEACAISQPALSLQIKELEAILGAALFERGARQTRLTALGQEFVVRVRDILRAVDELEDLARGSCSPLAGRLRIGVIPTVAPYLLPSVIAHLSARFPAVDLRPREAVTQTLLAELSEGRLDAAIVALPVSQPSLCEQPLFDEEFMLVRPAGEAGRPVPNAETLRRMRLLLLDEGHCFRDQALSYCKLPSTPRDMVQGNSLSTLVQMVGAGIGVTLIPQMAVPVETRSAPVSVARLPAPRPSRTIGIVWRKSTPLASQLSEVAEIVRRAAGPCGGASGGDASPEARRAAV